MNRGILIFIATVLLIISISTLVILLAQGRRFDTKSNTLQTVGILSVIAEPKGASIRINDKLVGATDQSSFNLDPGEYEVNISKDGYSTWSKKVKVVKGLVTEIESTLYPVVPNLSAPLTFTGIRNSKLSPDQRKIIYTVKNGVKSGIWVLDLSEGIFQGREPRQIATDRIDVKFSDANTEWSSDSNSILASVNSKFYLLDFNTRNEGTLNEVTNTVNDLRDSWKKDTDIKQTSRINKLPAYGQELAKAATNISFSPDETKFFGTKDKQSFSASKQIILYDSKPLFDPEHPREKDKLVNLPNAKKYFWLPNSRNLVMIEENTISVIDRDGSNKTVIYSGSFDSETIFPNTAGTKIVFAATFNPAVRKEPDLYTLELK